MASPRAVAQQTLHNQTLVLVVVGWEAWLEPGGCWQLPMCHQASMPSSMDHLLQLGAAWRHPKELKPFCGYQLLVAGDSHAVPVEEGSAVVGVWGSGMCPGNSPRAVH